MRVPAPPPIRFGPFELHTQSGELRRNGSNIRLQDQPFQALALLLEHPGEVVTREQFKAKLWRENTFVDFDRGLNKAINRLRSALRDNAEKPRFIETLDRRGYRFIASIEDQPANLNQLAACANLLSINSLAVLPLVNLSGDVAEEYFSDGMTEELIAALCRISSLRVISRTSAMTYKNKEKSVPEIAKELRVDAIVEGSVTRSGDKVRIVAQLLYAPADSHLWAGRYERDLSEVLQLQADIAKDIATRIEKILDPAHQLRTRARQVHPRAYEAWLKAGFLRDKLTPECLARSLDLYRQAIDLDPEYGQAHGDLSQAYFYLALFGMGPPQQILSSARTHALKALQLDKAVVIAHNALAAVHVFDSWDWAAAEAECRRAVDLSPGVPGTHIHLADYISIRGRHDEAIAEHKLGLALDPISRVYTGHFGLLLYRARRYRESIEQCRKALDIDPNYVNALWFLAFSLQQTGAVPEATACLEKAVALSGAPHLQAFLACAYGSQGQHDKALHILNELKACSEQRYVSPFDMAIVYLGVGDLTSAFEQFEQALQQRVFRLVELVLPMFDPLHSDPRWQDLVKRIRLVQSGDPGYAWSPPPR